MNPTPENEGKNPQEDQVAPQNTDSQSQTSNKSLTDVINDASSTVNSALNSAVSDVLGNDSQGTISAITDAVNNVIPGQDSSASNNSNDASKNSNNKNNEQNKDPKDTLSADKIESALASAQTAPKKTTAEEMEELKNITVDTAFANQAFDALAGISFDKLIGNPLRAAVKAQREMAKEALNYIKSEGIKTDKNGNGQITYVTLNFFKEGKQSTMRIPLLTLVPYPSLGIDQMTYKFTAKIDAASGVAVAVGCDLPAASAAPGGSGKQGTGGKTDEKKSAGSTDGKPASTDGKSPTASATVTGEKSGTVPSAATDAAKAAATNALAKMTKAPSSDSKDMQASYSSKRDSSAMRDSRYSVETTIDITITAKNQAPPAGITKIMDVLDKSTEIISKDGELTISARELTLTNGHALLTASYRDGNGNYKREEVKCVSLEKNGATPIILPSGDDVNFIFSEKGTYVVKGGIFQQVVFVS